MVVVVVVVAVAVVVAVVVGVAVVVSHLNDPGPSLAEMFEPDNIGRTLNDMRLWFRLQTPHGWHLSDLVQFEEWAERHAIEYNRDVTWTWLAKQFDTRRGGT